MEHSEGYERRWWILGVLCLSLLVIGSTTRSSTSRCPPWRATSAPRQPAPMDGRLLHPGLRRPAPHRGSLSDRFGRRKALRSGS